MRTHLMEALWIRTERGDRKEGRGKGYALATGGPGLDLRTLVCQGRDKEAWAEQNS
jgi:hypothetical protein